MIDLSKSSDAELQSLTQNIAAEQKRRKEVSALQQDAKVASEQIVLAATALQKQGVGSRFAILLDLLPEEFIDWVALGGGTQKTAWKQPIDAASMYMAGDVVVYQGQTYKSLISQNSYSPSEGPNVWQLI